ncbi:ArsR/SmtB family transcription factor [Sphingomonas lenta]|uniref:Transcriptional regulator n=1 Tax=Sphingomonas lenta TaxID=1141887 RepID=A0A2A2SC75_9SPHN|nr:helix-turn-helix domain-containing protein [Sphingomonas lenta]PAX06795.1 transcriptional regulator [Sphingomonas lenta]
MASFVHPDLEDVPLGAVLSALADPARRAIVRRLACDAEQEGGGLACSVAAPPDLPRATMSNHYTVLRAAGLVRARKVGVSVLHTLRRDEVERRFPGVLEAVLAVQE